MEIKYDGYIVEAGAEADPWMHDEETLCMHLFLSWRKFPEIGRLIGLAIARHELSLHGREARRFSEEFSSQLYSAFLEKKAHADQLSAYEEWNALQQEASAVEESLHQLSERSHDEA